MKRFLNGREFKGFPHATAKPQPDQCRMAIGYNYSPAEGEGRWYCCGNPVKWWVASSEGSHGFCGRHAGLRSRLRSYYHLVKREG